MALAAFRPESSAENRPKCTAVLGKTDYAFLLNFHVCGEIIRCGCTEWQQMVCKDSCCEFFLQPPDCDFYFNFEISACGVALCGIVDDWHRTPDGRVSGQKFISDDKIKKITIRTTLPPPPLEFKKPVDYRLDITIPFAVLERVPEPGEQWRGNFYKCGDNTDFPHWAAWAAISKLDFHAPDDFGYFLFI